MAPMDFTSLDLDLIRFERMIERYHQLALGSNENILLHRAAAGGVILEPHRQVGLCSDAEMEEASVVPQVGLLTQRCRTSAGKLLARAGSSVGGHHLNLVRGLKIGILVASRCWVLEVLDMRVER